MIECKPAFYELIHKPTGMRYGGSSGNVRTRLRHHRARLECGGHKSKALQKVYTSWDDIEVRIIYVENVQISRALEAQYLDENVGLPDCCNELKGGDRPIDIALGDLTPVVDLSLAPLPPYRGGRVRGSRTSEETRRKISESNKGNVYSAETRRRMSESRRSSDVVKAVWEANKSRDHARVRINGVEYNSIAAASRELGIGHGTIVRRLASKNFKEYERL